MDRVRRALGLWRTRGYRARVDRCRAELQQRYNAFAEIHDAARLRIAEELIAQIGSVDAAIEGLASEEGQRDLSIRFRWGHDHRFNDTLAVQGKMRDRHVDVTAQFITGFGLGADHFAGKSVIDVGCWTGGTTLMLKALGAERVLALEEVQKYAATARRLAQDVYGLDSVTCDGTNLYDLETDAKYDIAYFPGVVYHLSDPVLGLRRLFNALCDGGEILIESAGIDSAEPIARYDGNRVFTAPASASAEPLTRGGWNWFLPSPTCLARWMAEAGFEEVESYFSHDGNRVYGRGKRLRFNPITRAGFSRREIE